MNIKKAIEIAKTTHNWRVKNNEPTSVRIQYIDRNGYEEETEVDLYSTNQTEELEEIWSLLCIGLNANYGDIIAVEAYGYVTKK